MLDSKLVAEKPEDVGVDSEALEALFARAQRDVDDGVFTSEIVRRIFGVVCVHDKASDTWNVDEAATEKRRAAIKDERKQRSVSFEEFYQAERAKIVEGDLVEPVRESYAGSMRISPEWAAEFRGFWNLGDDFSL